MATSDLCACGCGAAITADSPSPYFAGPACQRRWQWKAAGLAPDPTQEADEIIASRSEQRRRHYRAQVDICAGQYDTAVAQHPMIQALLQGGWTIAPPIGETTPLRRCLHCGAAAYPITEVTYDQITPRRWRIRKTRPIELASQGNPYHQQRCRGCGAIHIVPPMIGLLSFDGETLTKISYTSALPGYNRHIERRILDQPTGQQRTEWLAATWLTIETELMEDLHHTTGIPLPH